MKKDRWSCNCRFRSKKTVQELTGSASIMKSEQIDGVPVASVDKMLQGRVTGVQTGSSSGQPGGMASVRVRGFLLLMV